MRKHYFLFLFATFLFTITQSFAQVRITEVDPSGQSVKIKNLGTSDVDISSYWLCSRIRYGQISNMTILNGDYNLSANEEVEFTSSVDLDDASADLGLYSQSGGFGNADNMLDFLQWGIDDFNGRESVAVTKGIWSEGDFISVSSPYQFDGEATETGVSFWQTAVLSINDNVTLKFSMYPNPSSEFINIQLPQSTASGDVTVYDFSGQVVYQKKLNNVDSLINVKDLSAGNYFLKLVSNNEIGVQQFIKK